MKKEFFRKCQVRGMSTSLFATLRLSSLWHSLLTPLTIPVQAPTCATVMQLTKITPNNQCHLVAMLLKQLKKTVLVLLAFLSPQTNICHVTMETHHLWQVIYQIYRTLMVWLVALHLTSVVKQNPLVIPHIGIIFSRCIQAAQLLKAMLIKKNKRIFFYGIFFAIFTAAKYLNILIRKMILDIICIYYFIFIISIVVKFVFIFYFPYVLINLLPLSHKYENSPLSYYHL